MTDRTNYQSTSYEMLKCIWMASQVVEYKLCDQKFDCENCPFDKVIGNFSNQKEAQFTGGTNVAKIISRKLHNLKYDHNIIYLKNNLIAKELFHNTFYLGINPILTSFLDTVSTMLKYERGKNISLGEEVIRIFGAWGSVTLSAPMDFSIYDKVDELSDEATGSRWFAVIGTSQHDISRGTVHEEAWGKMHQKAVGIIEGIKSYYPKVGDTMHDGGTPIKFLHQLVGAKRYLNILNSLCS